MGSLLEGGMEKICRCAGNEAPPHQVRPAAHAIAPEAESGALRGTMWHDAPFDRESREHPQAVELLDARDRRISVLSGKDVTEPLSQPPYGFLHAEARQRTAAAISQRAQVIDSMAVIGMVVRPENGVDPVYPAAQELVAQVRRRVDEQSRAIIAFDNYRHARASVAWLVWIAGTPIARYARDAGRRTRAEQRDHQERQQERRQAEQHLGA